MTELIRLETVRFLDEHASIVSKDAFKQLIIALNGLGCLSDEETQLLYDRHNLKSW